MSRFPEPFATLACADSVELGPVGVAAHRSAAFEAYERAQPMAAKHEALLFEMLERATPAGRLYAALLLARHHPTRARVAWELLAQQQEPITYAPGGCSVFSTTLAGYARGVLNDGTPDLFAGTQQRPQSAPHAPTSPPSLMTRLAPHAWWLIGLFWFVVIVLLRLRG